MQMVLYWILYTGSNAYSLYFYILANLCVCNVEDVLKLMSIFWD